MFTRRFFLGSGVILTGILVTFFCFRTNNVKAEIGTLFLRSLFAPRTLPVAPLKISPSPVVVSGALINPLERDQASNFFLRPRFSWLQRLLPPLRSPSPLLPSPPEAIRPTRYSLSGSVTGISGMITLRANESDSVSISPGQPASFTFPQSIIDGGAYHVVIEQVPADQYCSLSSQADGVIQGKNVTDIHVTCAPKTLVLPSLQGGTGGGGGGTTNTPANPVIPTRFTIGGSVSGLNGTIALQNNSGDTLSLSSNGAFTFATTVLDGELYSITILTQPAGQTCVVTLGSGRVSSADVNAARVNCTNNLLIPDIDFGSIAKLFGEAPFTLSPTSDSAGGFTYSTDDTSVASVTGNTVTIVGAGNTIITATQAAAGEYAAGSVTTTLVVGRATPSITFNAMTKNYGDSAFTPSVSSNSPGAITFLSSSTSIATASGSLVTPLNAGTSTITASQAETANFTSDSQTALLTINRIAPTITFNDITKMYGDAPFTLSASSNSPGSLSYICTDAGIATIVGDVATIVGAGTTTITLTQATSTNYTAFSQIAHLFVQTIAPTISFSPIVKYITAGPFTPSPTSPSSGLFTYISSNASVATVSGSTITLTGAGTTVLTATQAAAGNYTSGSTTTTLRVYIDQCVTVPCTNGGICTPEFDSFTCGCEAPFSGSLCELHDTNCSPGTAGACLNEGMCIPTVSGGECACATCWFGEKCDLYDSVTCA